MKQFTKIFLVILCSAFFVLHLSAQDVRRTVNEGNRLFAEGKFAEAETLFRQALDKNINSFEARFNLGNALYRQKRFADAAREFQRVETLQATSLQQANAQYNLGNALFQNQEYAKSIEAYKEALRKNPQDEDARYNLALAQKMLQQQPKQEEQPEMQQEIARQMLDILQQMQQQPRQQRFLSPKRAEKEW